MFNRARPERFQPADDPFGVDRFDSIDFDRIGDDGNDSDGRRGGGDHEPPRRRFRWWRWFVRGLALLVVLFIATVAWLAITAPLSQSLKPPTPPSITLLSAEGTPIARRGAIIGTPVDVRRLPAHVPEAFLAIEDRRFYSHWGLDPKGIARAMVHNVAAGGMREGGSTITQQLAKNAFLSLDRTAARKVQEVLISFWLEAWLTKDEILSRYLSNVYFGDNVYGLDAAAEHYFSRDPDELTTAQAAMLAGLVKAPSRLAPTGNLAGARARQKLVVAAMVDAGYLTPAEAADAGPARLKVRRTKELPNGTYFADWVLPQARDSAGELAAEQSVTTTLELPIQQAAERAVRRAGLRQAQVALVAMRPDGRIVAMVGGKSYRDSPFNRATQARRQPGSTFKLFVYLAALRSGLTPDSEVDDNPITIADWSPKNNDGRYLGPITLERAFARSSNVAAARLTQAVGVRNVIRAARDLGLSTPIPNEATIALGTSTVSLLELTTAFASIAAGEYPVRARGLDRREEEGLFSRLATGPSAFGRDELEGMRRLLSRAAEHGTGMEAALSIPTFGKTGTTSDHRDALFVGYAGDLVAGVWVGNDDNSPNAGLSGGGVPARLWRDFMSDALNLPARAVAAPVPDEATDGNLVEGEDGFRTEGIDGVDLGGEVNAEIEGLGLNLRLGRDGSIEVRRPERAPPPPPDDERSLPPEEEEF